ncbi:hypothetical protein P154DRAFT_553064 [Amniculicola lignicola CBS 123094]|uniref:Altered inheritance of mitochondria protein 32 n=1 Tax=Amniculicola lignicola CBS 123094 TaxID=1392246 RepID=A0A6A5WKI5_9PLEO|nr:hypothetical protein P154DRAFT_553064 [Amniculicola lignicola CBS 123094]
MTIARVRPRSSFLLSIHRNFATISPRTQSLPKAIPWTPTCPAPTCTCAAPPPEFKDIDHDSPLLNTMATYSEQVVLCTGQSDWISNIAEEKDQGWGEFVRGLRGVVGRGGDAFDPFNNVMITASSLPAEKTSKNTHSALLFPSFKKVDGLSHDKTTLSTFATAFLKSRTLHSAHNGLSRKQKDALLRDESVASQLPPTEDIKEVTILICGHGSRDDRCGIIGPILQSTFQSQLDNLGIPANVATISHIGGHKFAGNVILYVPPNFRVGCLQKGEENALSGMGIWYGRVLPEHVEGIVQETIVKGRVIGELLRGGVSQDGVNVGRVLEEQIRREKVKRMVG